MRLKKRESIDVDSERDVVTAMIISTEFLTESQTFLDVGLLRLGYARTVAKWCNEYYEKYKQAPKDSIQSLFDIKSRAIKDKEQVELIRDFLSDLSGEFDENTFNDPMYQYFIDNFFQWARKSDVKLFKQTTFAINDKVDEALKADL